MKPIVGILLAALVAACSSGTDAKDGAQVFKDICASCHGPEGKPPEAMIARLGVRDLTSPEFGKRVTVELVENQVRMGSKNQLMPPMAGALRDEQIAAVAKYVYAKFKR